MHMNRKLHATVVIRLGQGVYYSQLQLLRLNWVVLVLPHFFASLGLVPSCLHLFDTANRAQTYPPFCFFFQARVPQWESADAGDRLLGFLSLGLIPPN